MICEWQLTIDLRIAELIYCLFCLNIA